MTRRKFIIKLVKAASAGLLGLAALAKKAAPRKFIRAVRLKKYPGPMAPLKNIHKQSKWSG